MILDRRKKRQEPANIQFISNHLLKMTFILLIFFSIFFMVSHFKKVTYFPIKEVKIVGLQHTVHEDIQNLISPMVHQGFFAVDANGIQHQLTQLPWVGHVVVHRIWPSQIFINIVEKMPIARWNNGSLISEQGELFNPPESNFSSHLPNFIGPEGKQVQMLSYYRKINSLLTSLHIKVLRLEFAPLSLWKMTFDNGIKLTVGHKDFLTRLDHFVKLYPKVIGDRAAEVEYIDLRYSNGLSIKWKTVT